MTETEEITEALSVAITCCKRQALNEFIRHLMPLLKQNNWDIEHVIDALGDYAYQREDWGIAIKHLEDASSEISRLRRL